MIPNIVIVFALAGQRLTLKFRSLPLAVWSELKRQLGFTPRTLFEGLENADVEAYAAIIWLERRQHNRKLPWMQVRMELEKTEVELELLDIIADGQSITGEPEDEDAPEEEDPTEGDS